jgi:integrase
MPIKKMNNGTYKVDVSLGINKITNKRERTTRRGIATLKEAKEIERNLLNKKDLNENIIGIKAITVIQDYLEYSRNFDKASSHLKKHNVFKNYITPFLQNMKLNDLNLTYAQKFKELLLNSCISNNYKRYVLAMMSSFLNYSAKHDYINKNPMKQIDNFKKEKVTMNYWTLSEFNTFIECVDNIFYKTMFWVLYYTGMRKGELLALTLKDLDLVNNTININKTCSYVTGKGYIITSPKTTESKRIIYINKKTVDILNKYINHITKQYKFDNNTPLFSINGELVAKETLRRNFKYYQKLAKVKDIRIHDLRHSHVALLI